MNIQSAKLVRYNANSRGKRVSDCVKRSISLAFDKSYNDVSKLLHNELNNHPRLKWADPEGWKMKTVWEPVIKQLGGEGPTELKDNTSVNDFCDDIAADDCVYVVGCGPKQGVVSHLVCIRDKQVLDSWDCRDYIVSCYYVVSGDHKQLTNIADNLVTIIKDHISPMLKYELTRLMNKYSYDGVFEFSSKKLDYLVKNYCKVTFSDDLPKNRVYEFQINIPFSPTMTEEEAIDFAQKTIKVRAYDRMYAIAQQEKELIDALTIERKRREQGFEIDEVDNRFYLTPQEQKFLNTLPGWVRPLVYYISIQRPGMYSDSYTLKTRPLPDDPHRAGDSKVVFTGWNANEIKWELNHYKETFEVPYEDYSPADIF